MKIVLVTGTRDDVATHRNINDILQPLKMQDADIVIHGDCPTGVDALVKGYCFKNLIPQIPMPARWDYYRQSHVLHNKAAGPDRNYDMCRVASYFQIYGNEVICLAFPKGESWSGTRHCIQSAEKWGIEVVEHML